MKSSNLILTLLAIILCTLFSCSKEEDPIEKKTENPDSLDDPEPSEPALEKYFTFHATEERDTSDSDNWLMIHNEKGHLLYHSPYESGDTLVFTELDTLQVESLLLTLLDVNNSDTIGSASYAFYSYARIEKGRSWTLPGRTTPNYPFEGETILFNLTVTDIPGWYQYNLRNINFTEGFSRQLHETFTGDTDPTNLVLRDALGIRNTDALLSLIDGNRNPRYAWISNIQEGQNVVLDGQEDLKDFEIAVDIDLPEDIIDFSYNISNVDKNTGRKRFLYQFPRTQYYSDIRRMRLGYLQTFDNYLTNIGFRFRDFNYAYAEIGNGVQPENIAPTNPDLNIIDSTYSNFTFTTALSFISFSGHWTAEYSSNSRYNYLSWNLEGPSNHIPIIIELPEEFSTLYPDIDLQKLELKSTRLNLRGHSWENYTAILFGDKGAVADASITESVGVSHQQ